MKRTKEFFIDKVRRKAEITGVQATEAVHALLYEISHALMRGEHIEIRNFGKFETKMYKERMGRNPKTGEKVQIPARRKVRFKECTKMREFLNR